MRVCPFSSKKEMNRSRMVALSILLAGEVSPAPLSVGGISRLLNPIA